MTPLERVSKTTAQAALSACYRLVSDSGHVQLPVFSEDGVRCVGVLNALDALTAALDPQKTRACDCMRPSFFVSADVRADDVLPLMRKNRKTMVIVRSAPPEGAVLGIVTEENILNALTGSLQVAQRSR
jgi:CBS domain containing-hemolysin-like protein